MSACGFHTAAISDAGELWTWCVFAYLFVCLWWHDCDGFVYVGEGENEIMDVLWRC